jgi:hypothetical protein
MKKTLIVRAAALTMIAPATAGTLSINCGDLTTRYVGTPQMPNLWPYFPRHPPGPLAYASGANLNDYVFAQCFLEPHWTVGQAIDALVWKAAHGQRLPDIPVGGA